MNAAAPHGPIATADAWQTLKPRGDYERLILSVELGTRTLGHAVEVTQ